MVRTSWRTPTTGERSDRSAREAAGLECWRIREALREPRCRRRLQIHQNGCTVGTSDRTRLRGATAGHLGQGHTAARGNQGGMDDPDHRDVRARVGVRRMMTTPSTPASTAYPRQKPLSRNQTTPSTHEAGRVRARDWSPNRHSHIFLHACNHVVDVEGVVNAIYQRFVPPLAVAACVVKLFQGVESAIPGSSLLVCAEFVRDLRASVDPGRASIGGKGKEQPNDRAAFRPCTRRQVSVGNAR